MLSLKHVDAWANRLHVSCFQKLLCTAASPVDLATTGLYLVATLQAPLCMINLQAVNVCTALRSQHACEAINDCICNAGGRLQCFRQMHFIHHTTHYTTHRSWDRQVCSMHSNVTQERGTGCPQSRLEPQACCQQMRSHETAALL